MVEDRSGDGGMCLSYYNNYWNYNNNIMIMIKIMCRAGDAGGGSLRGRGDVAGALDPHQLLGRVRKWVLTASRSIYFRIYFIFSVYFFTVFTNCWGVYTSEFWPPRKYIFSDILYFVYILFLVYIFLQFSPTAGACTRVSFDRLGSIYFRIYFISFIFYF